MRSAHPRQPEQDTGLLIVNADDWGGFKQGTDAIEACFGAGAISSSTAMVHMSDARRAAELALEHRRPIGLHLNLTQPFDAPDVKSAVRERQIRLCAHFARLSVRRWMLSWKPATHTLVADGIRDQLEEFERLYGVGPTHVDSHHHVHVCPDVFLSSALERGVRVRQTLSPLPAARGATTLPRRLKHMLLARRFTTTSYFWGARELTGSDGSIPIADAVRLARTETVEIMVHPSFADEFEVLHSEPWLDAIRAAPLGPYSLL
jgi:predicted glycoside hydrolase/deacetylase ChbG (UPF0249 family)